LSQKDAAQMDFELMGEEIGFVTDALMELAGLSCAQAITHVYPPSTHPKILIVCGPGNNGGDGLVCARHLFHFGHKVECIYPKQRDVAPFQGLKKQCITLGIPFSLDMPQDLTQYNLLVDAIFGYSFKAGDIRAPFDIAIKALVETAVPIASLDIPSGWDVELGDPENKGIKPDFLISLGAPKVGSKYFKGRYHFLGGRFIPPQLAKKYGLTIPVYPQGSQFVLLENIC